MSLESFGFTASPTKKRKQPETAGSKAVDAVSTTAGADAKDTKDTKSDAPQVPNSDAAPAAAAAAAGSDSSAAAASAAVAVDSASPVKTTTDAQKKRAAENKSKAEAKLKAKKEAGPAKKRAKPSEDDESAAAAGSGGGGGGGSDDSKALSVGGGSSDPLEIYQSLEKYIHSSWAEPLKSALTSSKFTELKGKLVEAVKKKSVIFPPASKVFAAFNYCTFDAVRVVIIGQDPYHGAGQAEGLCFSVARGIKIPSSLVNIFKELGTDIPGYKKPSHGSLVGWAQQGVLLLNAILTVESAAPASHSTFGWEKFTDAVIDALNKQKKSLVFILWGAFAQKKAKAVDKSKHCVITGVHPSGLSAAKGFYGSKPFSKCNAYLKKTGQEPINWQT